MSLSRVGLLVGRCQQQQLSWVSGREGLLGSGLLPAKHEWLCSCAMTSAWASTAPGGALWREQGIGPYPSTSSEPSRGHVLSPQHHPWLVFWRGVFCFHSAA